jgi:hypothetical protein
MRLSQAEIDGLKKDIAFWWRQSSVCALQMGIYLGSLRAGMPPSDFSEYLDNELSRLGISRSTAYRWMLLSRELETVFPNPHIREALVPLTSGRGILAACSDSYIALTRDEWGNVEEEVQPLPARLTPAAQEALSRLPAPPEEHMGESQAEAWAASFVKAMKEARARRSAEARAVRKTEAGQATQRQAFLDKLHNLAAGCSPETLREFREQLNQVLDEHDASPEDGSAKEEALGNGAIPVSQSQVGTGNLSPATQVKASDAGSAPNHPDRKQGGASPAPASQSAVPMANSSQSQVGTGKPSPAAQVRAADAGSAPNHPNRTQGGASPAPVSQSAVPAVKPPQSQVRTGNLSPAASVNAGGWPGHATRN